MLLQKIYYYHSIMDCVGQMDCASVPFCQKIVLCTSFIFILLLQNCFICISHSCFDFCWKIVLYMTCHSFLIFLFNVSQKGIFATIIITISAFVCPVRHFQENQRSKIVFCCIAACYLVVNKIFLLSKDQLRTFQSIFENNFTDFREAVSLEKIFEIVQENTLKCSKLIHFQATKN